jgi:hypothetical protein
MRNLKLSLVLASSLFVTTAMAAPKVGDQAVFDGTYVAEGMNLKLNLVQKISAYDVNTNVYTVDMATTAGTEVQNTTNNVAGDEILSEEVAAQIVEACPVEIGKVETITVPAGTFKTCHVKEGANEMWIAPVPFGMVKVALPNERGGISTLELSSFTRGN